MVNTLLIGLFIGQMLSGGPRPQDERRAGPGRTEAAIAGGVLATVDPEQRAVLREAFREATKGGRPRFNERRKAQRELQAAMVADPFDPDRMTAAFQALRTSETAMEQAIQAVLVEQFAALTPEQRRSAAKAIGDRRRGERRRRFEERGGFRNGEQ
ncbi:MAG: periplasmic heavy metal sensor [Pseudomonadota bacterium]